MSRSVREQGFVNPLLISSIILGLVAILFAGGFIWAYTSYLDQRNNVNNKVAVAMESAAKKQREEDEKKLTEALKQPYAQLVGPDDLGRVSLSYPKTWSVYIAQNGTRGVYEVYLHPSAVLAISNDRAYATRVNVINSAYESVLAGYAALIKSGNVTSKPITINNFDGVRLDGKFSEVRSGSVVIFKVREKTLMVATDSTTYQNDFNTVVIPSLAFNP